MLIFFTWKIEKFTWKFEKNYIFKNIFTLLLQLFMVKVVIGSESGGNFQGPVPDPTKKDRTGFATPYLTIDRSFQWILDNHYRYKILTLLCVEIYRSSFSMESYSLL